MKKHIVKGVPDKMTRSETLVAAFLERFCKR